MSSMIILINHFHYILLCKLVEHEIQEDQTISHKCLEIANCGLDVADIIFSSLLDYGSKHLNLLNLMQTMKRINDIDFINNTHLLHN